MKRALYHKGRARSWAVMAMCLSAMCCLSCGRTERVSSYTFRGRTMGTLYSVQLVGPKLSPKDKSALHSDVEAVLREVNRQMSIYQPTSEISQWNLLVADEPFFVSEDFFQVVSFSLRLAEETGGAFDPTVGPLVNLWGFGPDGRRTIAPTEEQITQARSAVGFHRVILSPDQQITKDCSGLQLDLGAVAKGFGVDKICALLAEKGWEHFLVEVGGETRGQGLNSAQAKWKIGVQRPNYAALPGDMLQGIIQLTDGSVATSGDYQNFFEDESGQLFAHIIDPRTARPAGHALASVSVFASHCMEADGLATALYVLGPEEGLAFIEHYKGAEALFVIRDAEHSFRELASSGFSEVTSYEPTRW